MDLLPLGEGRFAVTDPNQPNNIFTVAINSTMDVRCTCDDSKRYHIRCVHAAAVLTNVSQLTTLPEKIESPDPLDMNQLHEEAVNEYLVKVNKALNLISIRKIEAMDQAFEATSLWKRSKTERRILKDAKVNAVQLVEAHRLETNREIEKDRAMNTLNILKAKSDELNGNRITAMSIKKTLRP